MNKKFIVAAAAGLFAMSGAAFAQEGTATGAAGGAVTGAIVGGPVGAVVGGVVGAAAGTAIDPPPREVREYVVRERAEPVVVQERIVVGEALPQTVVVHRIPEHETYSYAYVNEQRVIVETDSGRVVEIVE
ncbi:DUF1236 domain-containing protein [Terrihabitans sp. B22-R8]|uniref:DUF1236 domain-containing protein n=1 Tax=Terrihabitans sp. B22-R8 TaxID=3425128 RepID=UPI00403CED8F